MKNTKFIATLCMFLSLVFAINLINATVNVSYNAHYAVIKANGEIEYTEQTLSNFDTTGYVCTSADCSTVGDHLTGLTAHTDKDKITLNYPTKLQNINGYGVYFYKQGYIGWEMNPNWQGTGTVSNVYDIYFLKKEIGFASITNLTVVNEIKPNLPIAVGLDVGIDADTSSAIENNGPLTYEPAEVDTVNSVNTLVTLEIRDCKGSLIHSETKTVKIPYSESVPVSFAYNGFEKAGDYSIKVYTDVNDEKIVNSQKQEVSSKIKVIPLGLTDYGYTTLGGLTMTPTNPAEDEKVKFQFNYLSNYVDPNGSLIPVNTKAEVDIYQDDEKIKTKTYNLTSASDLFAFNEVFEYSGDYKITVKCFPVDSNLLTGKTIVEDTKEITFKVKESEDNDDDDEEDEDEDNGDHTDEEGANSDKMIIPLDSLNVIDLKEAEQKTLSYSYKSILYIITAGILILVILIAIVAIAKYR